MLLLVTVAVNITGSEVKAGFAEEASAVVVGESPEVTNVRHQPAAIVLTCPAFAVSSTTYKLQVLFVDVPLMADRVAAPSVSGVRYGPAGAGAGNVSAAV